MNFYIGIDIATLSFFAAIKVNGKGKAKKFDNTLKGFKDLRSWVEKNANKPYHFCMESTGKYGNALAEYLFDQEMRVSIVNPVKIKYFMGCQLTRSKTDKVDSFAIRDYCELFNPSLWKPSPESIKILRELNQEADHLTKARLKEQNRLESADKCTVKIIRRHIKFLEGEFQKLEKQIEAHINKHQTLVEDIALVSSIPGIGNKTSKKIIAYIVDINHFERPKQLAAFAGLNPHQRQSGTSMNYSSLSKTGHAELRKAMYMPALVAIRFEPGIKRFYENLVARGKSKKLAICAVMRKLLHIVFGVLKSKAHFNAQLV